MAAGPLGARAQAAVGDEGPEGRLEVEGQEASASADILSHATEAAGPAARAKVPLHATVTSSTGERGGDVSLPEHHRERQFAGSSSCPPASQPWLSSSRSVSLASALSRCSTCLS